MGVAEAVQWWGDWQLRILVLGSLFIQYFLFATAALRKRRIPPWLRFSIWLAYISSDAVAIYALATLLNHQKKRQWVRSASNDTALEALWAPVLLLHLGGRDGITAFSIEDNELWKRHLLTAASQIAVAIYVFYKSWSGDVRLFQATILIFVPGILKCLEKPWALNRASIYSMANTTGSEVRESSAEAFIAANLESNNSLDDYVIEAVKYFKTGHKDGDDTPYVIESPYKLFVDLSYSYAVRFQNLKYMARQRKGSLRKELYSRLLKTFDRFYTKRHVYRDTLRGLVVRTVAVFLTFAAIGLFHMSRREAYSNININITYILLCCTATLEFTSACLKPFNPCFLKMTRLPWPDQVAQYNLIWYLACRKKKQRRLFRWLAGLVGCRDRLDRLCCMESCKDNGITELIHGHITKGWKTSITNADTYRKFNDNRGQLTLKSCSSEALVRSLRRPFDESVLLWHLATDFCFYKEDPYPSTEDATRCRRMSNYMAYLLFVHPEMLIPGARYGLFKAAYYELRYEVMGNEDVPHGEGEEELARRIVGKMEEMLMCRKEGRFVLEAWALAQELLSLREKKGEKIMWRLIQGVWVEMLCFSAGRSRGYLHAKSLGKGGEYLSCVWLLLWYMGMETFAVRLQRTGLPEEGDMSAAVLAETPDKPADAKPRSEEEPSSTVPLVAGAPVIGLDAV
ncbi:unnamed protein product [Urochloa decumbens]|uniref:DUF4220 domain-containing protein n=1 Tax=Urochloa decumbens TaxID=240449 RepID=A0ABC9B0Y6_9POAL